MNKTFKLWKDIITNPFEGFKGLNDNTKILIPFLTIIVLFLLATTLLIPIITSNNYSEALTRAQITSQAEKGNEMSLEQQAAMAEQLKSPLVRNINIASSYAGGLIGFVIIGILFLTFISKITLSILKKDKVKFSLVLKIILFTTIVSMVQMIVKNGITVTGNWERVFSRVNDMKSFTYALQSPISIAALLDPAKIGDSLYMLIDVCTDVFNWIYYIFLYAGFKIAVSMEKKHALIATIIIAVLSTGIGVAMTSLI